MISTTDNVPPNTEGSTDSMKSQLPQHPSGTREKNERNELIAVLPPELPPLPARPIYKNFLIPFFGRYFLLSPILHPMPLL